MAVSEAQSNKTPVPLPRELPEPQWLGSLIFLQKLVLGTATLLTSAALISYSWSVHTHTQWNQQYQKLQMLKRQERGLTVAIETLENDLVQNLPHYESGLVRETRERSWYITVDPKPIPTPPDPTPTSPPLLPIRGY